MLKREELPPLQKRILLYLAENGPQTRNEVQKHVKSVYKNILFSFKSLNKKGLIQKVSQKRYRQRVFPEFWLTDKGLICAVFSGANLTLLLKNTKKVYPNDTEKALMVELATVDKELFATAFNILENVPEPRIATALSLAILTHSQIINKEQALNRILKLKAILSRYPQYHMALTKGLDITEKVIKLIKRA